MKKFLLLALITIFSFNSCSFFVNDQLIPEEDPALEELEVENNKKVILTGNIIFSGAVPQELLPSNRGINNYRTAIPAAPASFIYKYKIDDNSLEDLTLNAGAYSIPLSVTDTAFTVTIYAYTSGTAVNPLLAGSVIIPSAAGNETITENIVLNPYASGTGTVKLAVKTTEASVYKCFAQWKNSSGTDVSQSITLTTGTTEYFTMNDATSVDAQSYEVTFTFYTSGGAAVYRCVENVNVFSTMETNCWLSNGSIHIDTTGNGTLLIDNTCTSIFNRYEFYVSSTSSTSGTGTFFDPVNINRAVDLINSVNDGSLYTIYLLSDISPAADDSNWPLLADGSTKADTYVTIKPTTNLKLKIESYGNPATPYKIDAGRTAANPGRVIQVGAKTTLTLSNVEITGGYTTENGAGIQTSGSVKALTLENTIVRNNVSESSGGGLYFADALGIPLSIDGNSIFEGNTAKNGGAMAVLGLDISIKGNTSFVNNTCTDTGNAIYIGSGNNTKVVFSQNISFDHSANKQTVHIQKKDYPIYLGNLTGTIGTQTFVLTYGTLSTGTQALSPLDGTVTLSSYTNRFKILNTDLSASGYKIDSSGAIVPEAIGINGGNASSEYTVISTLSEMIASGSATAGVYSISTYDEMKQLSTFAVTSNCSGYTFVLYDNIIMDDTENFTPIGNSKKFAGTFDGNGNKITKLNVNVTSGNAGLFGSCNKATIKNLYVEGTVTSSASTVGGIVGSLETSGVIDNCVSNVKVTSTYASGNCIGGICGDSLAKITNCINLGEISGNGSSSTNVGGITGYAENSIINCANFGKVSGNSGIGGITGKLVNGNPIGNSYNYGKVVCSPSVTEGAGAIEGNGQTGNEDKYSDVYYHANSGVSCAVPKSTYTSVGTTFTDPEALRTLLNSNIYSYILAAPECKNWDNSIKIGGVSFPVPVDFDLSELAGIMLSLSSISEVPANKYVTYTLTETADFVKLASWVNAGNTFEGFSFVIPPETPEIHLSGTFTPIGKNTMPFMGTFDGNNVKISSLVLEDNMEGWDVAMFGEVKNAEIKNVKIEGSVNSSAVETGRGGYAGLVASAKGNVVIDNCDVAMVINVPNQFNCAGILSWWDPAEQAGSSLQIRNCINRGSITCKKWVGGILGAVGKPAGETSVTGWSVTIENCANYGGITSSDEVAGGIAGRLYYSASGSITISNCFSNATGGISGIRYVGNIVGQEESILQTVINNCYYHTTSAGESKYEGSSYATITDCNTFRTMNTKYQVYESGNYFDGTPYTVDTDLIDIVNNWVTVKNTGSSTYRSWKYESSQLVFE